MGYVQPFLFLLSPMAASLLVASIWQGILLTLVVALCLRVFRDVSPATRSALWTAALVLIVALPLLSAIVPGASAGQTAEWHVPSGWSVALVVLWSGLSAVRAVRLAAGAVRLWRLARRAVPVQASPEIDALLKGSRSAALCVSGEVERPSVAGFLRPRILLPPGLLEALSATELEHVVLHEMEHLRRWDDWLNLLQQVGLVLLPLNPALLWLDRRLCRERELACDDGVLRTTRARRAYAACLVKLAEDSLVRQGVALALSALGSRARRSELVVRVHRILAGPEAVGAQGRGRALAGAAMVALLLLVAVFRQSPELVRFDAMPELTAQTAPRLPVAPAAFPRRSVLPVAAGIGEAKPVLTRAEMPRPAVSASRLGRVSARLRAHSERSAARLVAVRAETRGSGPNPLDALVPAVQVRSLPQPHLVVTEFDPSQPVYAAVPYRGGWLIVQL